MSKRGMKTLKVKTNLKAGSFNSMLKKKMRKKKKENK